MIGSEFEEEEDDFRQKVHDALKAVKCILELHRNPQLAQDVDHQYGDKYRLVEQMTNTALIGQLNVLSYFGLTAEVLKSIDKSKPTTLRFQASESHKFLKEETVDVPTLWTYKQDEENTSSESSDLHDVTKSIVEQLVHHVPQKHWKVDVTWEISIYSGPDVDDRKILKSRTSSMILIVESEKTVFLQDHEQQCNPLEFSLSWLMEHIDNERMISNFCIDRQAPSTKTPNRNKEVESAQSMMYELQYWMMNIRDYFTNRIQKMIDESISAVPEPTLASLSCDNIFIPVQPLFETSKATSEKLETQSKSIVSLVSVTTEDENISQTTSVSPLLSTNDMHRFLNEQIRCIDDHITSLQTIFPSPASTTIISITEATFVLLSLHSERLGETFGSAVRYVESMLRNQLVTAVGKSLQATDIDPFLRYHNARLLNYAPKAFCYAIRQAGHDPCGLLSIESMESDGKKEPIQTFSREIESSDSIKLQLNSATIIELTGRKYLHGWIRNRFGDDQKSYELIARARQFSSFLLVVGTIAGSDNLDPKDAIIIRNKDELLIPLLLYEIPTSKEFKDAIQSLSPEQQRFAKSFRSMQLGSSVMGICVIQIQPQLEALLGLPHDALLKEMKLKQELMELFIEYQIPSDLLSYDGMVACPSMKEMVDNVRGHAAAVYDVIRGDEEKSTRIFEPSNEWDDDLLWLNTQWLRPGHYRSGPDREYDCSRDKPEDALSWLRRSCVPVLPDDDRSGPDSEYGGVRCVPRDGRPVSPDDNLSFSDVFSSLLNLGSYVPLQEFDNFRSTPLDISLQSTPDRTKPSIGSNIKMSHNDGKLDFTMIPKILDSEIERHCGGATLRSTTVKLGDDWQQLRQENILTKPNKTILQSDDLKKMERNKALDLLDALSRSGSLQISHSEIHVIVTVTHSFERDVIDTIVQDNINPIEKLEMSSLIVGSTIYGIPAWRLVRTERDLRRLETFYPTLVMK